MSRILMSTAARTGTPSGPPSGSVAQQAMAESTMERLPTAIVSAFAPLRWSSRLRRRLAWWAAAEPRSSPGRFGAPVWRSAVFGVASLHSDGQKPLTRMIPTTRGGGDAWQSASVFDRK
jgi:hypothetical protein